MDVTIAAYLTLLQILDINMTFKNRSRKVTRICFLLSFSPKSWLVVTQNLGSRCFLLPSLHLPTENSTHLQSRAMNYVSYLKFSSFRSNQNLLLFTLYLKLKLLFTSFFIVQIVSDASFLSQYVFQNPFDLEQTQLWIGNTLQMLNI